MKIILSPAKNMKRDNDSFLEESQPVFIKQAEILLKQLKSLEKEKLQEIWQVSDKLFNENYQRLIDMDLYSTTSPAIFNYYGIAYQHLGASVFTYQQLDYLRDHLRILSGFYGLLRPFDGIREYRLEMQAKLAIEGYDNLYKFWGSKIADELYKDDDLVINLASKEYSKVVEPYLTSGRKMININFYQLKKGKLVQQSTFAKAARGEMVNYMAINNIEDIRDIIGFSYEGLQYKAELSDELNYTFVSEK